MTRLIKIPFIFITTYSVVAELTNPNADIDNQERRPDGWYMKFAATNVVWIRTTYWVAATAEILVILAGEGYIPSQAATNYVLATLMPKGSLPNLRITPLSIFGTLLAVTGSLLRIKCFHTLKEHFTFHITVRRNHKLITHGPYGYVRHPSYTGFLITVIGLGCWFGSRGSWLRESGVLDVMVVRLFTTSFAMLFAGIIWGAFLRMPEEDKLLKATFGKEWERWAQRVPYWIIPGVL